MTTTAKVPERCFEFLQVNERGRKPRQGGVTEIRGPYYTVVGKHYLQDLFETMGAYVDCLKFAGGSFTLMPPEAVREINDLCHAHNVLVSTGGLIERVVVQGPEAVGGMRRREHRRARRESNKLFPCFGRLFRI